MIKIIKRLSAINIAMLLAFCCYAKCSILQMPELKAGIPADIVWPQAADFITVVQKCSAKNKSDKNINGCIENYMVSHGASKHAIAFAKLVGGPVKKITNYGPVGMAVVVIPGASNPDTIFLISRDGKIINTARYFDLSTYPAYQAFIKKFPDASFGYWPNTIEFKALNIAYNHDHEFIFSYPLTRCHACVRLGEARISYSFDKQGVYKGTKVTCLS